MSDFMLTAVTLLQAETAAAPKPKSSRKKEKDQQCITAFQGKLKKLKNYKGADYDSQIKIFKGFLQEHPACPQAAVAYYQIGARYEAKRDFKRAVKVYRKLVAHHPSSDLVPSVLSRILRIYANQKDFANIFATLKIIKKNYPQHLDKAIKDIVKGIGEDSKNDSVHFTKSINLFLAGLTKYLNISPSAEVYFQIGEIYEKSFGDLPKAIDFYSKSVSAPWRNTSEKFSLMFHLGELYQERLKDLQKALEIYRTIANENPGPRETRRALQEMGKIYEKQQRFLEAAAIFENCASAKCLLTAAYLYIRYGNSGKGDFAKAKEILRKIAASKEIMPADDRSDAKNLLAALEDPNFLKEMQDYSFGGLTLIGFKGTDVVLVYDGKSPEILKGGRIKIFLHFNVKGMASDSGSSALQLTYKGTKIVFLNPPETISRKNEALEMFASLPEGFFENLEYIIISSRPDPNPDKTCGRYSSNALILYEEPEGSKGTITLKCRSQPGVNVHELMHHWDISIAAGENDPSSIYYSISWTPDAKGEFHRVSDDPEQFYGRTPRNDEYPTANPREDFACAAAAYFKHGGDFREKARELINRGKFELAIKYLFIKHITPFAGKEYKIRQDRPGLDFQEVERELKEVLDKDPTRVRESTIEALKQIKKITEEQSGDKKSRGCGGCSGCLPQ